MSSPKPSFSVDWSRPGNNDERVSIVELDGPRAGSVESIGPGLWPRFSPTDDRIAFVGRSRGSWDIFVRSADRLNLARLTDSPATDSFPLWFPDASRVLFLSNRGNRWDLYDVDPSGSGPTTRRTTHARREDFPSLAPDASRVALTDSLGRGSARILLMNLADESVVELLPGPLDDRDPAWSPDGKSIAFVSRRPTLWP